MLSKPDLVASVCPHDCPSTCALEVERLDDRTIGRIHGAKGNSYTDGVVCAKVARYAERVHHPERLTTPLRRTGAKGSDEFTPISWDEALDEVAAAFAQATEQYGSESVWPYFYAGTMGLVQRDGIERFRHALRYSRQTTSICVGTTQPGWLAGAGRLTGVDPREMAESDLIVLWSTNAVATQINVMSHVAKARKGRGAKLVVVDPYRNPTAETADIHLCPRPGSDGALACAIMHVLFRDGFADREYLAKYTDVPDELEAHLETRTPEWAAAITGLSVDEIEGFATLYGRTERAFIRLGYGLSRHRNGAATMHAVSCLPAICGHWRHRGGGALYTNSAIYPIDRTLMQGLDVRDRSIRTLDMSRIGPVLNGDPEDIGEGPPVAAMLIQNTNPVVVAPDQNLVRQGFAREDLFVCVHEQFLTDTARYADIVLPATTFLEHDDLYQSGGHSHLQLGARIIEPLAESRPNHFVHCALAHRLGGEHPGFEMSELEIIDATLKASGLPDLATLKAERWHDCMPDFEQAHFLDGFGWPDGKFRFKPDWPAQGRLGHLMPELPDHWAVIEEADAEHPFKLLTSPARNFLNTSFTETPGSLQRERQPTLRIHPDDARELNIGEGSGVRLGNRRGRVELTAMLFDGLQRGVLVVESIWPNRHFKNGSGINSLTGADSPAPAGGAAFHDVAVWVEALE
ncbi:MAG: molybdopterin oxidoreductase family protein [Alphaproteobacteria bacterium]|nr:molybdopterin oxidoreductase family protein [Alphaproteobacteria bacterium]MDP6623222.1 molybdopterin oxidoreductase family protein [Alphaproteobacteria bacterium]